MRESDLQIREKIRPRVVGAVTERFDACLHMADAGSTKDRTRGAISLFRQHGYLEALRTGRTRTKGCRL
ncbi:hypothetical protein FHR83_005968 [Actinoplanes campanulatus]|uniref:Uncharacterized protein n=1 Tax=Actinoplanes campanulatus TaxID=113559 RepID=A0A7W5FH38_9ACTN|nr:hypothetical protein [Actinoplanes campanulatus]MBB3098273.1 hypothetical protein [Actinoplanes campanulatus]GGN34625.1 hypothetical protein GCM10010109_57820 [Actinoplanes campanulatus]GID38768.1 hypothetical protein Aca09nite_52740 [Actinoplanes campanulatus]